MLTLLMWVESLRIDLLGELALATVVGGLIGLEREWHGKPAGLRTNILICVGATLLTDLSMDFGFTEGAGADGARLSAQIVSGIGFLGAGTIIQSRGTVSGLTSAATLWVVAAIGIAIGSRHWVEGVGTAVLVLGVLYPLGRVEHRLSSNRTHRILKIRVFRSERHQVQAILDAAGVTVTSEIVALEGDLLFLTLDLRGPRVVWPELRTKLIELPNVRTMELG